LDGLDDVDPKRLNVLEVDVTSKFETQTQIQSSCSDHYPPMHIHLFHLPKRDCWQSPDEATIEEAASKAKHLFPTSSHHLRLAFCIPGILYPEKSPSQLDHSQLIETFATNTIGPLLLTKHFTPFLPKKSTVLTPLENEPEIPPHAVWLTMSARVGSTSDNALGGWYSYRASKAGVNSITKSLDLYLRTRCGEKAMAIAYHPGTVKTGLSKEFWGNVKEGKLFSADYAVEKMIGVVNSVGLEGRGRCWDWKGEEILPW
jgi:NAD(P)-dependent dehydrogenase (short-subunit alcohol dehydrogenase family)